MAQGVRCVAALVLAALHGLATAAAGPLSVDSLEGMHAIRHAVRDDGRPARDVALPFVRSPGAPGVAQRINAAIYLSQLSMPPPVAPQGRVALSDDFPPEEQLQFDVLRNDAHVLSLAITSEFCIGHCIEDTTILHFDARTGRRVMLADLLSSDGEATALRMMADAGIAAFAGGLARLPPPPREPDPDEDDSATPPPAAEPVIPDPIALDNDPGGEDHRRYFESCKTDWEADRDRAPGSAREPTFELPTDGALQLAQPRCLEGSRRMQRLSEVDVEDVHLAGAALERLLSPYGRALLMNGPASRSVARLAGHVMVGRVGDAPATLMFDEVGCDVSWYRDHERRIMSLATKDCGPALSLSAGTNQQMMALRRDGDRLVGTWRDGTTSMPATFAP